MFDIFISYAREDQARVKELVSLFEGKGWSVFWDRRIPAGKTWRSHIGHALENTHCIIVIWSKYSTGSDWVNEEADEGKKRGILIPILLDSVQPPHGFREIQAADLTEYASGKSSEILESLLADISSLISQKSPDINLAERGTTPEKEPVLLHDYGKKNKIPFNPKIVLIILTAIVFLSFILYFTFNRPQESVIQKTDQGTRIEENADVGKGDIQKGRIRPQTGSQWFVIVGSFPVKNLDAAERHRSELVNSGYKVITIKSDDYPLLEPRLLVSVIGPFESKEQSDIMLRRVKQRLPEAYVKQGR